MTSNPRTKLLRLAVKVTVSVVVATAGTGVASTAAAAQSAQVAAGTLSRVPAELARDSLAREIGTLTRILSGMAAGADRTAVEDVIIAGLAALGERADEARYLELAERYRDARIELARRVPAVAAAFPAAGARGGGTVLSGLFRGDVVFTIGSEVSFGSGSSPSATGTIATNLLGAGVGAIFDAIGSDALEKYFTENVAAGTSIPLGSQNSLTAQIGVGLGSIRIRRVELWPVINFEQTDTADTRTPDELDRRFPQQKIWSAPTFAVGIVLPGFTTRLQTKGVAMVPVVGIRAPHYFPGDPFTALAAMFSSRRSDYARSGRPLYSLGVAVPLVRVK